MKKNFLFFLCNVWLSTCRVKTINFEPIKKLIEHGENVILTLWHCDVVYILYHHRKYKSAIIVSPSKDGEWAAEYLKKYGNIVFRGSRMKGGLNAVNEIISLMKNEKIQAGIVADGSKGPAHKAQNGAIFIAKETGSPIVTASFGAKNYIRLRSWDKTIIPLPFSEVVVLYGEPFYVPNDIKAKDMDFYRKKLEEILNNNKKIAEKLYIK